MEDAEAVDLSKENIQPLKQGRNASILGLALQAQTDEQIHQRLLKMQEAYELRIRTYNGPDPLDIWVEYISWVEQSFPKHGLEGNLEVLLQKCFTALKDEERYKQDVRFVKLWIKFIEMQTTDRLEVYRFLSGQGIGTACSEFYQAWAYEFEQMEDYKHADAVFQLGYKNVAQPAIDLEAAHTQFQLRVARAVLNNQMNNVHETVQTSEAENQRSAMASLCPVGPKHNKVGTVRVGSNVLSAKPGTLPNPSSSQHARLPIFGSNTVARDRIQIYKEDSTDSVGALGKGISHAPSTSVHSYRNKENTLGAGTWNKPAAVRSKVTSQAAMYQTQFTGPSFEVHRDEAAEDPLAPASKTFTPNVLKPRKHEENHLKETLAVYEQTDPSVRVMYPKHKVYAGGKELQLEEIMAIEHWREMAKDSGDLPDPVEQERLRLEKMKREIEEQLKHLPINTPPPEPISESGNFASSLGRPIASGSFETHSNSTASANRSESKESLNQESDNVSVGKVENRSTSSLNFLLTPGEAPSNYATSSANALSGEKMKGAFDSGGRGHNSMYNQSITVHTKLAMNEVDDLWRSPNPVNFPASPDELPTREAPPKESVLAFDICRDETYVPPQRAPVSSGFKTPSVLSERAVTGNPPFTQKNMNQLRVLSEDAEESLARTLGPDMSAVKDVVFKEPMVAAFRGSLNKRFADENLASTPLYRRQDNDRVNLGPSTQELVSRQANAFPIFSDEAESAKGGGQAAFNVFVDEEMKDVKQAAFNVFVDEQETKNVKQAAFNVFVDEQETKNVKQSAFNVFVDEQETKNVKQAAFNVFVDEQETKKVASTIIPTATPSNKLDIIAKEKENAQKFSLMEIEEIAKKPKMAPSRRSILPQLNGQFKDSTATMENAARQEFPYDDDTCSTKVFSGGFLIASTPFTGGIVRGKVPESDFESRDLNGSIFVNPQTEEMAPPKSIGKPRDTRSDDQLSTIYELSSSSNRTSSSQSAASGICTASSAIRDHEGAGAPVSTEPQLDQVEEEKQEDEFHEPYHYDVTVCINGDVDPFDKVLVHDLLRKHSFPQAHHKDGLKDVSAKNVPTRRNNTFVLDDEVYRIIRDLGEGAYAKVFQVVEESTKRTSALKLQKPSWQWEYYICREIQLRLENKALASSFMHADKMYVFNNGSILLTELVPLGSLLNLANKLSLSTSTSNTRREAFAIIMADHLLRIVDALHSCDIIHGDLKPDNILIRSIPTMGSEDSCLILIDFGRSIDMSLFPPGTTFQRNVKTDGFACVEMQTNRPWTYQTDLYGLASTIHCLLLGKYMKVREISGRWHVQQTIPRSADKERWTKFFCSLLNVESCHVMPNLKTIREDLLNGYALRPSDYSELECVIKR